MKILYVNTPKIYIIVMFGSVIKNRYDRDDAANRSIRLVSEVALYMN